uniref:Uncharacterized protein n=1 Tax=Moniliophthora roreri TaxID=221103 RepID=A0A0W0FCB8_MONRR
MTHKITITSTNLMVESGYTEVNQRKEKHKAGPEPVAMQK